MEKNQIWIWYKDEVMIDFFIIKDIVEWEGEMVAYLYGDEGGSVFGHSTPLPGKHRQQFFDDMELLENITDIANPEEAALIIEACKKYSITIPGQIVRIDKFKASGKWYETLELDMGKYYEEYLIHDAVKKAIKDQYPSIKIIDGHLRTPDSGFIVCLKPFHKNSFPVTIWLQ